MTPSFTALHNQAHDAEYYASIASFRTVAEKFDPVVDSLAEDVQVLR